MIRATLLSLLAATPLAAQDADPAGQLVEGFVACLSGAGDAAATAALLEDQKWLAEGEGEDGVFYFRPGAGDASFAFMAADGRFCHVESTILGSETTAAILVATLDALGGTRFEVSPDDMGCASYALSTGSTATLTSGGNDPTCASQSDSAVRFSFETAG